MVAASRDDSVEEAASALSRASASLGQRVLVLESTREVNGDEPRPRQRLESGLGAITIAGLPAREMASTLVDEEDRYDMTVISTPSPAISPLAITMAGQADLVVLVATVGQTSIDEASEAADLIRGTGAELAAGILVANGRRRAAGAGDVRRLLAADPGPEGD
jgi:hypothetical protein